MVEFTIDYKCELYEKWVTSNDSLSFIASQRQIDMDILVDLINEGERLQGLNRGLTNS